MTGQNNWPQIPADRRESEFEEMGRRRFEPILVIVNSSGPRGLFCFYFSDSRVSALIRG